MSKAKFEAARELIAEKKYDEARRVLAAIDHPTAREWEAKLDRLDPPIAPFPAGAPPATAAPKVKRRGCSTRTLVTIAVLLILVVLVSRIARDMQQFNNTISAGQQSVAQQLATINAVTSTPGPSPTITDTPVPSDTPMPSQTPLPSATPTPDYGSRNTPYPLGQIGTIRDGQFRVNSLARNATAAIEQMNRFNPDPAAGEEWVIVSITFQCGLAADDACHTSLMQIEMVGDLGSVYSWDFAVLDDRFEGDVLGGGQRTGNLAFIIKQQDTRLMIAVNDLGERTFFSAE